MHQSPKANSSARAPLLLFMLALLGALPSRAACAADFDLLSIAVRARVDEKQVLGQTQLTSFREYDVMAAIRLPWKPQIPLNLALDTRLMASVGVIKGAGKTAAVASVIPALGISSRDGRFVADMGAGLALISKQRYAQQYFGGLLQFALTLGFSVPLYGHYAVGYRFLHYSDAGAYGPDTIGTDFHMVELIYRF